MLQSFIKLAKEADKKKGVASEEATPEKYQSRQTPELELEATGELNNTRSAHSEG